MIKVGKRYTLITLELTESGYSQSSIGVTVTKRDGNLIEVNGCEVLNTASPMFHSLVDEAGRRAFAQNEHDRLMASLEGR